MAEQESRTLQAAVCGIDRGKKGEIRKPIIFELLKAFTELKKVSCESAVNSSIGK
jgi:hypothetical protein